MPSTTSTNALVPNYNTQSLVETRDKGEFPMRAEYFEDTTSVSENNSAIDAQLGTEAQTVDQLHEHAKNIAYTGLAVTIGGNQEQPAASPVREGITNNPEMARREVGTAASAVVTIREAALPSTEEQRNAAQWN